ncbi:MAG: glycosyl transferase [Bacteroidales bacterium]|nr:glycosyl transferase [Bacteroidales bacterium]
MFEKLIRRIIEETPVGGWLPDKLYLSLQYRCRMGRKLHLDNPQTFNEKIQWLKIHDRNPLYPTLVDKVAVKEWAAAKIGEEYIIPTLAVWDSVDEIDLDALPERFVLKCTHDSGSAVLCTDKASFDLEAAKKRLSERLALDYGARFREWPYSKVPRRILVERFLDSGSASARNDKEDSRNDNIVISTKDQGSARRDLSDYKFFCFSGKPELLFIATERNNPLTETRFDFFDEEFRHIDVRNGHPNADVPPQKPEGFEEMKRLAATLSEGLPFVRVDFYEADGKVYFGEMTLYHWSGLRPFEPEEYDLTFGKMIKLP